MAVVKSSETSASNNSLKSMDTSENSPATNGKTPLGARKSDEAGRGASKLADMKTLQELDKTVVDDADFLAWLNKNNSDASDPTRYYMEHSRRDSKDSLHNYGLGERKTSSVSNKSHSPDSEGEHRHSPVGHILHALHLDRKARRHAKKRRALNTAQALEQLDMERWEAKIRQEHDDVDGSPSAPRERSAASRHSASQSDSDSGSDDSGESDTGAHAAAASSSVPLALLNPDLIQRNAAEHSGNLSAAFAAASHHSDEDVPLSSERIDQMIKDSHKHDAELSLDDKDAKREGTVVFGVERDEARPNNIEMKVLA
ncbi:uncharacterized protein LOC129597862 [Paramacrobiotus metropolitanus]|uniref:uncharacterized protein LOC129597862 n=1 Tax=Paramacrobiotus metropolitanus TaxID=2943436 RepID=UPI0024458DBF|nr:uncharacterized protein LOC129597862 [Paramacrobiotus metropolitanus]XP_055351534.1 uncharacterized protein LOC129597862 [Paramacrobiotus metropolitanus]